MPNTFTPNDALTFAKAMAHGIQIPPASQMQVLNSVNNSIWLYYPWSWAIKSLTPITCIDGVQDYVITSTNDVNNINRILKLQLARTDTNPTEVRELAALANLSVELTRKGGLDTNTAFGYFAASNTIRLMYAASVGPNQTLQIQAQYYSLPTTITQANLGTVFQFPDHHIETFLHGLVYWAYVLNNDTRAGSTVYSKNGKQGVQYTGQLALFKDSLRTIAAVEDLATGDQWMAPESGLGQSHSFWPGLWGV